MTTLYSARQQVSSPAVPRELGVVILFCLLGLTISWQCFRGSTAITSPSFSTTSGEPSLGPVTGSFTQASIGKTGELL